MHSMKLYSYTSNPTESVAFPCIEYYPMVALAEHALASASLVLSVRLVVLRISGGQFIYKTLIDGLWCFPSCSAHM